MTPSTADKAPRTPRWPGALVWALAWLFMFLLQPVLDLANLGMLLVLAAALAALWWPPLASLAACALAVLLFNFSFVPPLGTFTVDLHQHALLLVTMLSVSWLVALLMVRQRRLAEAERLLAQRARQLQEFGERLRDADKPRERAPELTAVLTALAHRPVRLLLQGDACPPEGEAPSEVWEGLCTCLKEGQALGPGTGRHEELDAWFLPLRGRRTGLGAAWLPLDSMPQGDRVALRAHAQALCDQMGLALERAATAQVAATAREEAASHSLRNTLLAAISHDYRTPLATILGAASSLHDQDDRLSPAQRRRLAATIIDEAGQLGRITDNTLQLARLDRPGLALHLDWESAEEIVGTVLRRTRQRHPARQVLAHVQPDLPLLRCDAVLLVQLLDNLVDNALKHGGDATPVEIHATLDESQVRLAVRDRGRGIPAAWRERVFDAFQRGAAATDAPPPRGAGVGLALCRLIARAHGGELVLIDREGGGCSAECALPAESEQAPAMEAAP